MLHPQQVAPRPVGLRARERKGARAHSTSTEGMGPTDGANDCNPPNPPHSPSCQMKKSLFIAAAGLALVAAAPAADEVTSLPGWSGALLAPAYSGFLSIPGTGNKQIHYLFYASQTKATGSTPLVMWFNGGPGCVSGWGGGGGRRQRRSVVPRTIGHPSLTPPLLLPLSVEPRGRLPVAYGGAQPSSAYPSLFFIVFGCVPHAPTHPPTPSTLPRESGPYWTTAGGQNLQKNEYSWNTFGHSLYFEAPTCVGFSTATGAGCTHDDTTTAEDNLAALQAWYKLFPEYATNPLWITGESYAGIYIPMLAYDIVTKAPTIPLNGILVGNGCIGDEAGLCGFSAQGDFFTVAEFHSHAMISESLWNAVTDNCPAQNSTADAWNSISNECSDAISAAGDAAGNNFYIYQVYAGLYNVCAATNLRERQPPRPVDSKSILGKVLAKQNAAGKKFGKTSKLGNTCAWWGGGVGGQNEAWGAGGTLGGHPRVEKAPPAPSHPSFTSKALLTMI